MVCCVHRRIWPTQKKLFLENTVFDISSIALDTSVASQPPYKFLLLISYSSIINSVAEMAPLLFCFLMKDSCGMAVGL